MPSGEQRPFISQENVRAALDGLLYTSAERLQNPLHHLLLVDEFLADPDMPAVQHGRAFALHDILTGLITHELQALRQALGLPAVPPMGSQQEVFAALLPDAAVNSPELTGWDWLYCRYVRVDLNLSHEVFCQALHIDERTLRRYQQHAVKRLTERLIQAEWDARAAQRKRRLTAELPGGGMYLMFGRQDELQRLLHMLETAAPPHIYITGAAGVGKSTVAEAFVGQLIEEERLDQLIWVARPASAAFARNFIIERMLPEGGSVTLRDILQLYRTAIVLDGLDQAQHQLDALQSLLAELSGALVVMTGRHYAAMPDAAHLPLGELDEHAAAALIQQLLETGGYLEEDRPDFSHIWETAGGNPLAIKLFVHNLRFWEQASVMARSISQLFDDVYPQLDDVLRQNWFMFALLHPGPVEPENLQALWPTRADRTAVARLLQQHLVESSRIFQAACTLTTPARRYIEDRYRADDHARQMVQELVDSIAAVNPEAAPGWYDAVEYMLLCPWLTIDSQRRRQWMSAAWQEGLRRGRWAAWRSILEANDTVLTSDAEIYRAYGICLRRLGEWKAARQTFETLIFQSGRAGAFVNQANALVELAVLLRYEGEYETATVLLARAEQIAARYRDETLLNALKLERAQIALDTGRAQDAGAILETLPKSRRTVWLESAYYLLIGEYESSRLAAEALLAETSDAGDQARLYTLIGQAHERQNDLDSARLRFSAALTLLETQHDPFALGRAQANLGALLMKTRSWAEALLLLLRAERLQAQLNDRVALEVTRHNLRMLKTRVDL